MDVFNPAEHKLVAIDKDGRHLHVTLLELAMDMSEVDFAPFFARMRELEKLAEAHAVAPPAVDLSPLERRLAEIERRPAVAPAPEIDRDAIVAAVLDRVPRPAPLVLPDAFDPTPLRVEIAGLEARLAAADRRHVDDQRAMQTVIQAADALLQRIQRLEEAVIKVAIAAEKELSAA